MRVTGRVLGVAVAVAAVGLVVGTGAPSAPAAGARPVGLGPSSVPVPTVVGPVTGPGAPSLISTSFDLATVGYQQDEYFISGTATRFQMSGPPPADGRWKVRRGARARYKTRLLVYRPSNPKRFNGTVVVEWLDESAGADTAADWIGDHTQLIRQGFAWVGVSAQQLGINGGTGVLGGGGAGLKKQNPPRVRDPAPPRGRLLLRHLLPGGPGIRHPVPAAPLGPLKPTALIADGESQSAFFLTTYIDAIAPVAHVFNGYLVHSRWSGGTTLSGSLALNLHEPFRTDLHVPVLAFETETDLDEGYVHDRQPDSRWFRDWEVAGTSHADDYTTLIGLGDSGRSDAALEIVDQDTPLSIIGCTAPPNAGPGHWVLDDASPLSTAG